MTDRPRPGVRVEEARDLEGVEGERRVGGVDERVEHARREARRLHHPAGGGDEVDGEERRDEDRRTRGAAIAFAPARRSDRERRQRDEPGPADRDVDPQVRREEEDERRGRPRRYGARQEARPSAQAERARQERPRQRAQDRLPDGDRLQRLDSACSTAIGATSADERKSSRRYVATPRSRTGTGRSAGTGAKIAERAHLAAQASLRAARRTRVTRRARATPAP